MKVIRVAFLVLCSSLPAAAQSRKPPSPTPPPSSPAARGDAQSDTALLRAILQAYEPAPAEVRALAVEDLGLLGDPRALNVLADCALDPNPLIRDAAVKALRAFQDPRAEEILANLVRHPRPSQTLKIAALEGLAYQRTPSSVALLKSVRDDTRMDPHLRDTASQLLSRVSPSQQR